MKELMQYPNVVGYGTGFKYVGGKNTGQVCKTVLVTSKLPKIALRSIDIVPTRIGDLPADVIEVGVIRALKDRTDKWRPAPPGVSIGHYAITAGTFGCVVRKDGQRFILSNNHVLANQNDASIGDDILQPGKYDGGQETIAYLEEFVPINFENGSPTCPFVKGIADLANVFAKGLGSSHRLRAYQEDATDNLVDAAIAIPIDDGIIVDAILEIGMIKGSADVQLGQWVVKSGRTTGLTTGTITVVEATVKVQYDKGTATFKNQIISSAMSEPGDSGSVLVNDDNEAVGLLYAGSDQVTIYNKIDDVINLLGVEI
jgi:hypothetical protein